MSAFARALADRLAQGGHRAADATVDATAIADAIASAPPGLIAPDATLADHLAARLAEPDASVAQLEVADIYLAWACSRGDDAAIRAFERLYFGAARVALTRMQLDPSGIDEVLQMVREKLFVAAGEAPAKVLALAGRGNLGTLVRVTAVRLALNLQRDARLADTSDDDVVAALSSETDPQRQVIAQHERAALKQAIEAAVRGLEPRQRNLVRMHLLHRLSIDEISGLYRISRATAARWLAQARADIERGTRRYLHEQLALAPSGIDSMLKIVQHSLEVSFDRILAP